ncbi:MAG: AMP-dependent synthetase [Solirubrobacterales bacterium]|nr:AMP-dependent synthetase [Solirubrobacterales bacterium]
MTYGWSSLPPAVLDDLQRLCDGVEIMGIFGQTEAVACHRYFPRHDPAGAGAREDSAPVNRVGVPSPLLASKVTDAEGHDLRGTPGVPGEAVYRSPVITAGYFRDEGATREAFRDGWFHSGDLCAYDEDGGRVMLDRTKDIVKSGGENVSSIRVESVLMSHPSVGRCAVVGVPDDRWGEAVTACVVAAEGAEIDPAALVAHCRARLAGFETPKRVEAFDELPATVGGKVLKHRLREQLRATATPGTDRAPG